MFSHYRKKLKEINCYGLAIILISVLYLYANIVNARAMSNDTLYNGFFDVEVKAGTERNVGRADLFLPLIQNPDALLFANLKAMASDEHNQEYNLGLGYRRKLAEKAIVGVYGFFDLLYARSGSVQQQILDTTTLHPYKLSTHNTFHQLTFGAELLTETWDFRANYYKPLDDSEVVRSVEKNAIIVDNTLLINEDIIQVTYSGFDVEIGKRLSDRLGLYAAYYHFETEAHKDLARNDTKDLSSFDGYRLRGELDIFKRQSFDITLNAEYSDDDVRDDNLFVGLNFSFKFGGNGKATPKTKLEERMTNKVVRDLDIVTQVIAPERQAPSDQFGNPQKFYYVAANAVDGAGDGSEANPFSVHDALETDKIGNGAIIYFTGGTYKLDGNVKLKPGQKLYGTTVNMVVDNVVVKQADLGNVAHLEFILTPGDTAADRYDTGIRQTDFDGNALAAITLADYNIIAGLHFVDDNKDIQNFTIFGHNVSDVRIGGNKFDSYSAAVGLQYNKTLHLYNNYIIGNNFDPTRIGHWGGVKIIADGKYANVTSIVRDNTFGIVGRNIQKDDNNQNLHYYQGSIALVADHGATLNGLIQNNHFGTTATMVNNVAKHNSLIKVNIRHNTVDELQALDGVNPVDSNPVILEVAQGGWIDAVVEDNSIEQGDIESNEFFSVRNGSGSVNLIHKGNLIKSTVSTH